MSFTRILVAVDGSENSSRAAAAAATLAEKYGSELIVLTVVPGRAYDLKKSIAERNAKEVVDKEIAKIEKMGAKVRSDVLPTAESIVGQIVDYSSKKKVDLIVMGTRGLGGFKRLVIGSVSSGVVTHAPCPVMVVR